MVIYSVYLVLLTINHPFILVAPLIEGFHTTSKERKLSPGKLPPWNPALSLKRYKPSFVCTPKKVAAELQSFVRKRHFLEIGYRPLPPRGGHITPVCQASTLSQPIPSSTLFPRASITIASCRALSISYGDSFFYLPA